MRLDPSASVLLVALVSVLAPGCHATGDSGDVDARGGPNSLSAAELDAGWMLLFDGESTTGWRGFGQAEMPDGWRVEDGCLACVGSGGDIVTEQTFADFELVLEWRISPGGNSGIFYRVTEEGDYPWLSGPEMQVLDNSEHADGKSPFTSAGSAYALYAPEQDDTRPVGEFNQVRIVVRGPQVEHWLNGVEQCEYELWSEDWHERVAASKFASMPNYGLARRGHIALQDHGDLVWYRNIKIREL